MEWKITDFPVKKKFRAQRSVKKIFCDIERSIIIDFFKERATVNCDSNCQLLWQYFTLFVECPSYFFSKNEFDSNGHSCWQKNFVLNQVKVIIALSPKNLALFPGKRLPTFIRSSRGGGYHQADGGQKTGCEWEFQIVI